MDIQMATHVCPPPLKPLDMKIIPPPDQQVTHAESCILCKCALAVNYGQSCLTYLGEADLMKILVFLPLKRS